MSNSSNIPYSFIKKDPNNTSKNYLQRILDLPIYSYLQQSNDPHINAIVNVGAMNSDVNNYFNGNCISGKFKFAQNFVCPSGNPSTCSFCSQVITPNSVFLNANYLLYYHILAFQEFVNQTQSCQTTLQSTMNSLVSNLSTTETNQINSLQTTITNQASQIAALQASITALQNQQTLNTNNIQVISTKIGI